MKTVNIIACIVSVIAFSCCSDTKTNSIEGLWYSCHYNGDYEEILFTESYAVAMLVLKKEYTDISHSVDLDMHSMFLGPYKFDGDTLKICSGHEKYDEKSPDMSIFYVNFITSDQIEFGFVDDPEMEKIIVSNRITDYPKPPGNMIKRDSIWWREFNKDFENRIKIYRCPDLRTRDEILRDSLDEISRISISPVDENFEDLFNDDDLVGLEKDSLNSN